MAYKRHIHPEPLGDRLPARMAGLGMAMACAPEFNANIEDTVLQAVRCGMEDGDLRVLGLVTAWLEHYQGFINADRIIRCLQAESSTRILAYWASRAQAWSTDIRWKRLRQPASVPKDLLPVGTAFQVERRGEDPRFANTALRVPSGTLRDRAGDVEPAHVIAKKHRAFRWRVLMGPSYRADCLALAEVESSIPAAELARRTYSSFATAWGVLRDLRLLTEAIAPR